VLMHDIATLQGAFREHVGVQERRVRSREGVGSP
jgi:hypothetical protein